MMNDIPLLAGKIFLLIMLVLYWPMTFKLIDSVLNQPKKRGFFGIPLAVFNTILLLWASSRAGGSTYSYFVYFALLMLDIHLYYKDTFVKILFCASACILHIMALRALTTGVIAAILRCSVFDVANQPSLYVLSIGSSTAITNIAVLLVTKFIPAEKIRIINQHREQQWFLTAWMSVFNLYLIFNSGVFWEKTYHPHIVGNEIIVSIAILLGLYIVVFFAFKTISLLGYKEKSAELQREVYQEQQFRNAASKDAIMTYEVNITQNKTLRGFEENEAELGEMAHCYSDMLVFLVHRLIYSEDIEKYMQYSMRSNLIREFEEGKTETTIEYRRLTSDGKYIWVRAITNLIQSVESGDLIAYVFVKDIEVEKQHQLKLQYKAERDALTGLYNREMTEKLANEALIFNHTHTSSALFMIDVDNFKEINDRFGHVFGDAVLCELAEKLQRVFRADDIVGRIGGDEYIAFMKGGASPAIVAERAAEICKVFHTVFNGENGEVFLVTGSVGVSVSPQDGERFEQLYLHADAALYEAKDNGKNTYAVYRGKQFAGYQSSRNEIPQDGVSDLKSFRQNRVEYIFKILYQADNPVAAIHSALELVANHFSFERGYIFEMNKDGKTTSNIFEWCAEGVAAQIDLLQNIPIDIALSGFSRFCEEGIYVMRALEDSLPAYRQFLEPLGIRQLIQFGIFDHGRLLGFIGFDNCENDLVPSDEELEDMKTICNILATFFVKHRIAEDSAENMRALTEVMNSFEKYIYVIDPKRFRVLFMNEKMRELMSYANVSEPCYSFFRGNHAQCEDCPLNRLAKDPLQQTALELYNEKRGIWLEANFSYLRWTDGSIACMISCLDITPKKISTCVPQTVKVDVLM